MDNLRLHLGCGRSIRPGWINIDAVPGEGIDLAMDLDADPVLPYPTDSVIHSEASHLIEHLRNPLPLMQELWRVTKPGGSIELRCPYGSSDDADEDPTHVRRLFVHSWGYFSQPYYWRADYGYRGDWRPETVRLRIDPALSHLDQAELQAALRFQRNVVTEMTASLVAVKPAREQSRELIDNPTVVLEVAPAEASETS